MTREFANNWLGSNVDEYEQVNAYFAHELINKIYDEFEKVNKEIYESAYNQGYADAKCELALSKDDGEYRVGKALNGEVNGGLF